MQICEYHTLKVLIWTRTITQTGLRRRFEREKGDVSLAVELRARRVNAFITQIAPKGCLAVGLIAVLSEYASPIMCSIWLPARTYKDSQNKKD